MTRINLESINVDFEPLALEHGDRETATWRAIGDSTTTAQPTDARTRPTSVRRGLVLVVDHWWLLD